ncbi:MAG TPA: DMT family transporter [Xanthobacteraceae bacterium]
MTGTAEQPVLPPGANRSDDLPRAVSYMLLVALFIPLLNASAKFLTAEYPVMEVVWARYAGHFLFMVLVFAPRLGTRLFVASRPVLQIVRSLLLCISSVIFIFALKYVPLTTATAMSFTGPFMVTALAPVLLGERVGWARWAFVAVGFAGAVIILRPGSEGMNAAAFLLLGSALSSALYQIMSRKLAAFDRVEVSITYTALAGFVVTSIPLPFIWVTPHSPRDWLLFAGLGLFGGFGHYFLQRAFELAPAPFVSPFNYLGLVGAALLSVVVFGQFPDLWVWVGAFIIAASGILMLLYEHRRRLRAGPGTT